MKKTIAVLSLIGVFAIGGLVLASGGVGYFDSLHVGEPGIGGVTYFNGSIVNEDTAVTIADDLRVDGAITRGFGPVKVNDDLTINGDLKVEGMAQIGASKIASHWLNSDGVQANYVLRAPHDSQAPTGSCDSGDLYADVTAGSENLYLCNELNAWIAL